MQAFGKAGLLGDVVDATDDAQRTAFAIAYMVCGTIALAIPGLTTAFWGIPWVSLVFYGLAVFGVLTLMRRGALLVCARHERPS